jgi:hypothetical protein
MYVSGKKGAEGGKKRARRAGRVARRGHANRVYLLLPKRSGRNLHRPRPLHSVTLRLQLDTSLTDTCLWVSACSLRYLYVISTSDLLYYR